jgi:hypothetical protein
LLLYCFECSQEWIRIHEEIDVELGTKTLCPLDLNKFSHLLLIFRRGFELYGRHLRRTRRPSLIANAAALRWGGLENHMGTMHKFMEIYMMT